jgi:CRP-like cAMP-binding protein
MAWHWNKKRKDTTMSYGPNGQSFPNFPVRNASVQMHLANAPKEIPMQSTFAYPVSNHILMGIPQAELSRIRPHLTRLRLVAQQVLLERGRPPEHVFFIEEGLASLVAETEHDRHGVQVAMIGREGMVGGLALLDPQSAAYASVVMQIPGPALRIPTSQLRKCLEDCPMLREACLRFVQSLTRQIMSIAARNARCTLVERSAHWLLMAHERMEGGDLPVTHEALSLMLGVRRSGVTVATAALQKAGLIRTSRGRIRILDPAGLEAVVHGRSRVDHSEDGDFQNSDVEHPRIVGATAGLS